MFGTIRRHQKWLWIAVSTVTIISFVAFFSPQQRRQGGWTGPKDQIGSINGRPITRGEYASAYHEAEMRHLFTYGDWPGDGSFNRPGMMENEARQRLLLLEKLDQLDIQVTESAVAQWIMEAFRDRNDKSFREEVYKQFLQNALPRRGLTQADFERFARHEVGIQHLVALAGTAGKLVTPQEAEAAFRRQNEEVEVVAAVFASSNFLSQVDVDPVAIATYYTNHQANYRIPEKLQVAFVRFASSNYLAEADQELAKNTNLNQYVETTYIQRGTNAFTDAAGVPLPPADAKQKIRDEVRQAAAMEEARQKAVAFANELFSLNERNTNSLENLAAAKGLVAELSEPFTTVQPPANMKVPSNFGQIASRLTVEEPLAEQHIQGEDGYYVVALKRRIPSEIPPLENVLDRVTEEYRNSQAMEQARAAGRQFHVAVTNGLAQDKSFEGVAAEQNISPVLLPPFSRKATTIPGLPNSADVPQLVSTAFTLSPGKVSNFVPTRSGGFVVTVKNVIPVSDAKVQAELPEFIKTLRQNRQYEAFSDWFRKEMEAAQFNLPGERQRASLN